MRRWPASRQPCRRRSSWIFRCLTDGSGVEILKFIRLLGWDLCVIVLIGNPYDALRTKCKALGAAAVLDKLDGLGQVLEALLPRLEGIRKG